MQQTTSGTTTSISTAADHTTSTIGMIDSFGGLLTSATPSTLDKSSDLMSNSDILEFDQLADHLLRTSADQPPFVTSRSANPANALVPTLSPSRVPTLSPNIALTPAPTLDPIHAPTEIPITTSTLISTLERTLTLPVASALTPALDPALGPNLPPIDVPFASCSVGQRSNCPNTSTEQRVPTCSTSIRTSFATPTSSALRPTSSTANHQIPTPTTSIVTSLYTTSTPISRNTISERIGNDSALMPTPNPTATKPNPPLNTSLTTRVPTSQLKYITPASFHSPTGKHSCNSISSHIQTNCETIELIDGPLMTSTPNRTLANLDGKNLSESEISSSTVRHITIPASTSKLSTIFKTRPITIPTSAARPVTIPVSISRSSTSCISNVKTITIPVSTSKTITIPKSSTKLITIPKSTAIHTINSGFALIPGVRMPIPRVNTVASSTTLPLTTGVIKQVDVIRSIQPSANATSNNQKSTTSQRVVQKTSSIPVQLPATDTRPFDDTTL